MKIKGHPYQEQIDESNQQIFYLWITGYLWWKLLYEYSNPLYWTQMIIRT